MYGNEKKRNVSKSEGLFGYSVGEIFIPGFEIFFKDINLLFSFTIFYGCKLVAREGQLKKNNLFIISMSLQRNLTHNFNPVIAFLFLGPLQISGHIKKKKLKWKTKIKTKTENKIILKKIIILDYNQRIFMIFTIRGFTLLNK